MICDCAITDLLLPLRFRAGVRLLGECIAHGPEIFEVANIDATAEDFDRRALGADDVPTDDALHELEVQARQSTSRSSQSIMRSAVWKTSSAAWLLRYSASSVSPRRLRSR
jgi:hypothetical protein